MQYISNGYGQRIAAARLRRGLTQEQLADAVHMDRSHLSKVEAGTRSCSVDYIAEIAATPENWQSMRRSGREIITVTML